MTTTTLDTLARALYRAGYPLSGADRWEGLRKVCYAQARACLLALATIEPSDAAVLAAMDAQDETQDYETSGSDVMRAAIRAAWVQLAKENE